MHRIDGRIFGAQHSEQEQDGLKAVADVSRFRLLVDDGAIVGIAGSFAFDMTLPGGTAVPTGGVTWVSVAVTHRRQGLLGRLMQAIHADIDERGEPLAALTASEGGIYERFGYGIATRSRVISLERGRAALRPDMLPGPGDVRIVEALDALPELTALWDRHRVKRAGEVTRSEAWWRWLINDVGPGGVWAVHPDGFACWKLDAHWNTGHPGHELALYNLCAMTPDAHAALWHTVTSVDLVGRIVTSRVAIDDPLPFLLRDQRALRTTELNDGVWCNVRDVGACFGARTYGTDDDMVVEVEGRRWRVGSGGASKVRTRPDLVTDAAGLGALVLGGVAPSTLAAGRRLTASTSEILRRADAIFVVHPAPHCQTGF